MTKDPRKLKLLQFSFLCLVTLIGFACITVHESEKRGRHAWLQEHRAAAVSTVLLNNTSGLVPFKDLEQKMASVNLGTAHAHHFDSLLNKYTLVTSFTAPVMASDSAYDSLNDALKFFGTVMVQGKAESFANPSVQAFITDLQKTKNVVLSVYGALSHLQKLDGLDVPLVWSQKETAATADFAAQLIFGGEAATGSLPQTYSPKYVKGSGYKTAVTRLKYSLPEALGVSAHILQDSIDTIMAEAIARHATPGGVVLVVKDGNVIFNKAYGTHTYDQDRATRIDDIFDLASITKVSATTLSMMELYDQHKVNLNAPLGDYIPSVSHSNKAGLTVKNILLHQAGLPAGVGMPTKPEDLSKLFSDDFPVQAADSTFVRKDYFKDVVWPRMLSAKVSDPGKYVYSDLTMYFLKEVVERQAQMPLNQLVQTSFYAPLGMQTAGFLPLHRFSKDRIVPTENDINFRKTLLQGYVHDGGAAKLGGVSGHAGLFSTANDLAILYQMLLNGGSYGGITYLRPETVKLFTTKQSAVSRRGLGFDGYDAESKLGYPSKKASPQTYGHTGYTGTCVWVDPAQGLVYVFLSNRVYPKVTDKLSTMRIRPRIQDAIYLAIEKGNPTKPPVKS